MFHTLKLQLYHPNMRQTFLFYIWVIPHYITVIYFSTRWNSTSTTVTPLLFSLVLCAYMHIYTVCFIHIWCVFLALNWYVFYRFRDKSIPIRENKCKALNLNFLFFIQFQCIFFLFPLCIMPVLLSYLWGNKENVIKKGCAFRK